MKYFLRRLYFLTILVLLNTGPALLAAPLLKTLQPMAVDKRSVTPSQIRPTNAPAESASPIQVKPANGKTLKPMGAVDLLIASAQWSAPPTAGQKPGINSILNIYIRNSGNSPGTATRLQITCEALDGGSCPEGLSGTLNVSPLGPNQSYGAAWPSAGSASWGPGKYRLLLSLDPQNQVRESNEFNNKKTLDINIPRLTRGISLSGNTPELQSKEQKQEPGLTRSHVMDQGFESMQAVKVPVMAGAKVKLKDFVIQSLRHDPQDPHMDESCQFWATIENRTDEISDLEIYARCKPLDGGSCPGGAPGQEVVEKRQAGRFTGKETREFQIFYGKNVKGTGRFLFSVAKDSDFSKGLVIDMVHVPLPEDALPVIRRWCYAGASYDPYDANICEKMIETAGRVNSMKILASGVGWDEASKLICQYKGTGGGQPIVLDTEYFGHGEKNDGGTLRGVVPASVVDISGQYAIWAKKGDGKESAKEVLEILQPGLPLQIYEWKPKVITQWSTLGITNSQARYANIEFSSNRIGPLTDLWMDPSTVAADLKVLETFFSNGILKVTLSASNPKNGDIKFWIYNKHPNPAIDTRNNAQWIKIPVKLELAPLLPPVILTPKEGEGIIAQDVEISFQGQMPMALDLQWQKLTGPVWLTTTIVDEFDTEGGSQRNLTVKQERFPGGGSYRFRARVSPESDNHYSVDYVWGDWRVFDFKKN